MPPGGTPLTHSCRITAAALGLSLVVVAPSAQARKRGFGAGTCEGCHGETNDSTLTVSPAIATPGEAITLQIVLSDGDANAGGLFIETDDLPGLTVGSGEPLVVLSNGVTHTGPKPMSGGTVTFDLSYQVPTSPGATQFRIWTVAANGNDDDSGDETNHIAFGLVYGCEPQTFYADLDRDGHGRDGPIITACAGMPPEGFASAPDDCNDNDPLENPSAMETCNSADDNCNGEIDEDATPVELFPDADGDGYYSYEEWQSGDSVIGCLPYPGYGDRQWDCDPNSAAAHPGAIEVCDGRIDEDCDGFVDERVRPYCGEGACQRESRSCSVEDCTPGEPSEETCNFVDDDCDGELDEGDLCSEGLLCLAGACREASALPAGGEGADGGSPGLSGSGAGPPEAGSGSSPSSNARGKDNGVSTCGFSRVPQGATRKSQAPFWLLLGLGLTWLCRRSPHAE